MFVTFLFYLILAASPWWVYMCFKSKTRAWVTVIVLTVIIDIIVLYYLIGR